MGCQTQTPWPLSLVHVAPGCPSEAVSRGGIPSSAVMVAQPVTAAKPCPSILSFFLRLFLPFLPSIREYSVPCVDP